MPNFSDFRRLVLTPGKAEIDQLAAFTMDWSEKRGARGKITHVTLTFTPKDDDATDAAADEAGRHSSGRKARREGTTETIVDTASLIASAASRLSVSDRSDEHTSELQSLLRTSYAVACLQKKTK